MPAPKYQTLIHGYITTAEAKDLLHVNRVRVHQLIDAGKLTARPRDGRTTEVLLSDVLKLAASDRPTGRPRKAKA